MHLAKSEMAPLDQAFQCVSETPTHTLFSAIPHPLPTLHHFRPGPQPPLPDSRPYAASPEVITSTEPGVVLCVRGGFMHTSRSLVSARGRRVEVMSLLYGPQPLPLLPSAFASLSLSFPFYKMGLVVALRELLRGLYKIIYIK